MPKVQPIEANGDGGGRRRGRRVLSSLSEINVVPLVDVMLVLLIIFMVAAPMMQRGLDVNLPAARHAQQLSDERLFVSVPYSFRQDHRVRVNADVVRLELLQERMRQLMQNRQNKEVYLQSDAGLTVQDLMDVMDRLKAGGVEKVGLVARLPEER
ncbi:MAG TPA: biopolymer transporter ExbD [Vicinamibacterales bacterium]|nr:biopolymer transporter ExbD [Vicinamibacterales bacterium]